MCDSTRKENGPYNERDTDDEREKKAREIIGAFFASIIWFFVDLTFVWPESHQRAYWFALAFVIAQIVQISQLRRRTIIKALAVWIIIWAVFYPFVPPNPPKETETHFWLVPASDPSPANNPCKKWIGRAVPADAIFLYVGGWVYWIGRDEVIKDHVLVAIHNRPLIRFSREGSKITISGDVWNADGDVVAHIDHNEVHLVQAKYAWVEKTESDPSTFKVFGPKGDELLYLRFANPTTINFRGTFPVPNSPPLIISDSETTKDGMRFSGTCTHSDPNIGTVNF